MNAGRKMLVTCGIQFVSPSSVGSRSIYFFNSINSLHSNEWCIGSLHALICLLLFVFPTAAEAAAATTSTLWTQSHFHYLYGNRLYTGRLRSNSLSKHWNWITHSVENRLPKTNTRHFQEIGNHAWIFTGLSFLLLFSLKTTFKTRSTHAFFGAFPAVWNKVQIKLLPRTDCRLSMKCIIYIYFRLPSSFAAFYYAFTATTKKFPPGSAGCNFTFSHRIIFPT